MKSIFLGTDANLNIYKSCMKDLQAEAMGLTQQIYSKNDVISHPEIFRDTEYIFSTWGMPVFTKEEVLQYFPLLKCVFYGAGSVQNFARAFLESNVKVFSAWGANAVPVAEYTVAQILLANKGYFLSSKKIKSTESRKKAAEYTHTMPGNFATRVGIIGAGMIGKMVIERLKAFNLEVLVYDPFLSDEKAMELGAKKTSLEEIFSTCQTISNHVANLPETVGMFTYDLFKLMKDNAVFINTGRGAQVIEDDLIRILTEKPHVTAVLDVTYPEPPVDGSKLYELENVILTPHIAGSAGNEVMRMGEYMLDQFIKYKNGLNYEYEVTLKMLETMA